MASSACDLDGRTLSGGTAPLEPTGQPGDVPPGDVPPGDLSPDAAPPDDCAARASCDAAPPCEPGAPGCLYGCTGCLIEGECIADGSVNPANPCQRCSATLSAQGWSSADSTSCDDGLFCTVDDACSGGACSGSPRDCDDGVECNGVSLCDEPSQSCAPGESTCTDGTLCDVASSACVESCDGCVVAGSCVATGSEQPGNPCLVCDPLQSSTSYSSALGKSCGAAASTCSDQDTCDANGACLPNHSPEGAPCGSAQSSGCDRPDSCDGAGTCLNRLVANGTTCSDGRFCTIGDECQGGACTASGARSCGAGAICNEGPNGTGQCVATQTLRGNGEPCTAAAECTSNSCQLSAANPTQGICCTERCAQGELCRPISVSVHECVQCANDTQCGNGCDVASGTCNALVANGLPCSTNAGCASGQCTQHFADVDDDEYALPGAATASFCTASGVDVPRFTTRAPTSITSSDCCDLASGASFRPGQTAFFESPVPACAHAGDPDGWDYDCSGRKDLRYPREFVATQCNGLAQAACVAVPGSITPLVDCGEDTVFVPPCNFVALADNPFCQVVPGGPVVQACR
ncbi:MAG: hypothetical protein ABW217_06300 [Polyangiaceae bacterium]